jgi:hypothetical protein
MSTGFMWVRTGLSGPRDQGNPYKVMINFVISWTTTIYLPTYLPTYGYTALCWALAAFQFFNPIHSQQDSLDGGSALR